MRHKHKTVGSSSKPMPQVVSFQDPLPQARRYRPQAGRILSGDPVQTATNLFQSTDGRFNSGIWEAQPENGASGWLDRVTGAFHATYDFGSVSQPMEENYSLICKRTNPVF